jgi:hypothetical protein
MVDEVKEQRYRRLSKRGPHWQKSGLTRQARRAALSQGSYPFDDLQFAPEYIGGLVEPPFRPTL